MTPSARRLALTLARLFDSVRTAYAVPLQCTLLARSSFGAGALAGHTSPRRALPVNSSTREGSDEFSLSR
jgi:hypothetical protein